MYFRLRSLAAFAAAFSFSIASSASGQNLVTIDATTPPPPVHPVAAHLGTDRNPEGHILSVNSQYLTMDGKPWLPVMGELHYSRVPEAEWESSILKMKAAGVQIISTYVIWIHHEQTEGVFDWNGRKNLRHFAELCAKHGVLLYPRIGPWAHGEVRNGGLPDWVLEKSEVRKNNPVYLEEVRSFYSEIGKQLHGLYWKDGGPVIGIQLENEYRDGEPDRGASHIRKLKQIAIEEGMDVPLYTVTGWDNAVIPPDAVLPVYGGYPDAPWDASPAKNPPADVYAFRFTNRAAGSMGAIGGAGQSPSSVYQGTPFLTAEIGGGIQDTYFRRPVLDADDIAAMVPVMLGSGANLLGYYMFHGGRNPDGGAITLQESQRTGYPTDVPIKSYDFQAPISSDGVERASLNSLKLMHYFLNAFGDQLAPMAPYAPGRVPSSPDDFSMLRVALRTNGRSGYLFLNNYVRGAEMPSRPRFSVLLKLPHREIRVPDKPIQLPSGAYGIWPVNFAFEGATLRYSTAQLISCLESNTERYYFFFGIPGVTPEFWFEKGDIDLSLQGDFARQNMQDGIRVRAGSSAAGEITLRAGEIKTHLMLLPEQEAKQLWITSSPKRIFRFAGQFYADGDKVHLLKIGDPKFDAGIFKIASAKTTKGSGPFFNSLFKDVTATVAPVEVHAEITPLREAHPRGPWVLGADLKWRKSRPVQAPDDSEFASSSAQWKIVVKPEAVNRNLGNIFLRIRYQGDVARLDQHGKLVNDDFWNGLPWMTGIKQVSSESFLKENSFTLSILPLPKKYPMYLEKAGLLHSSGENGSLSLESVEAVPEYELALHVDPYTGVLKAN